MMLKFVAFVVKKNVMGETLLIFACLNGSGCAETSQTYAFYNPEVLNNVNKIQRTVESHLNPIIIQKLVPFYAVLYSKKLNINLYNGLNLELKENLTTLIFNKTF